LKLRKPKIAITIGDVGGIGPEVALKALSQPGIYEICKPFLIGDVEFLLRERELFQIKQPLNKITQVEKTDFNPDVINVLNVSNISLRDFKRTHNAMTGQAMMEYTEKAFELLKTGQVHAVVGGPHSKKAVDEAGISFNGYPGLLQKWSNSKNAFIMLVAGNLRVCNVTLHISMREACDAIKKDLVFDAIQAVDTSVKELGIKAPRIAVAGLNPHAGERGMFGKEEIEEIQPAILEAQNRGIDVKGPFAGDSLFYRCLEGRYDAYIGMYHDQAHIPLKTLAFEKSSGLIIGTPYVFATVGHGSAPDIAGKNIAFCGSMVETIKLVSSYGAHTL
jgi:4-hydroxythreonine-4-phosphate dehydrogenase